MRFPKDVAPDNSMWPVAVTSKILTSAKTDCSNAEREDPGIPQDLENCYHYCFTHKVSIITVLQPQVPTSTQSHFIANFKPTKHYASYCIQP